MESSTEMLVKFLESKKTVFIKLWQDSILIEEKDIYRDRVKDNGLQMYELVRQTLIGSIAEDAIKQLAYRVAKERVEAKINIGDFVYNVNLGRSIIINYVIHSGISIEKLQPIIDKINLQFDHFCYHAVTKYTELMNQDLQEKILFINETHKDKLSLLGQMSSSFVHEFRNPLTSVIGFIKLLKADYPNLKYLDIIDHELEQLKFRITQFLHTSKMDVREKKKEKVSIKVLVDEILHFLYPSIVDGDVHVFTDIGSEISIEANSDEIKQVFLNILLNSIDAVKQKEKPKEITLSCFIEEEQVVIMVSNNGPAIPPETQEIIFEPFYTTKELGTGIGLYVCKKIIEIHGGSITCISNHMLTTFKIHLPRHSSPPTIIEKPLTTIENRMRISR